MFNFMQRQTDINYLMRTILIDWLIEVSLQYELRDETLYLTVNYIDRFLSHMYVARHKLQLVGTAALWLAWYVYVNCCPLFVQFYSLILNVEMCLYFV